MLSHSRIPPVIATREHRQAIAFLVHALRPTWDRAGVEAALTRAHNQELHRLAIAAIAFAVSRPDQRTPAALAADGRHWHVDEPTWTSQPPAVSEPVPTDRQRAEWAAAARAGVAACREALAQRPRTSPDALADPDEGNHR